MRSRSLLAALLLLPLALAGGPLDAQMRVRAEALCVAPSPIQPTGVTDRPAVSYPLQTGFLHSAISLQGLPARVKWAGGLVHRPPSSTGFQGFTSALVVTNPHPTLSMSFTIQYFDHAGNPLGTPGSHTLLPNATRLEAATPLAGALGVGSARVAVTSPANHPGLVGAVLTHTRCIYGTFCDTDLPLSLNDQHPGASSMQQLQVDQGRTALWWGPLPLTLTGHADFYNNQAPFLWVVNPNDVPNTVNVSLVLYNRSNGNVTPAPWRTVTIPGHGTLFEKTGPHLSGMGLWDKFVSWYNTLDLTSNDFDVLVRVTSESGLPILGDGVMTDFTGDDAPRFRMSSQMLASTPTSTLISPDFGYAPGEEETLIGLFNVGTSGTGTLRVDFFDRDSFLAGGMTLPSLAPNHSLRIDPSFPGYPTATTGYGWVRIWACNPMNAKLVGWSVHEVLGNRHHKAFGESLIGTMGDEPGDGFPVVDPDGVLRTRKVMPLLRVRVDAFPFPGYTTFANTSAPNTGSYVYLFHNPAGGSCSASTLPFAGVRYRETSTTHEDSEVNFVPACFGNLSGRVDVEDSTVEGSKVLGDPLDEYGIAGFAPPS